ncbi:MAG: ATP-grasp domain-containing protein [Patescibacteria group bacterium]|jgi:D-alanine-D-alanine ligase
MDKKEKTETNGIKNGNGELSGKTILVVNTGSMKKRFIFQKLKKLGVKIIILNKEINWAGDYADNWILADTTNHSESLQQTGKFIKENPDIHIDGIFTFWEDDVLLTSKISDKFNFIGIPFSIAKKIRNKYLFRDFCRLNNLPLVKFKIIKPNESTEEITKDISFPMVIKPIFGSSSAFVIKIENEDELKDSLVYIKKEMSTSIESALTDGSEIMVEEYIDGDEVDMDILIQNSRMKFFSISDNNKTNEPFFIETGQSIPSSLPKKNQEELIRMADEVLEKLGIENGCIHFEAKSSKKGPVPIEVNLRMGGDEVYSFVRGAWKVDLIEYALKIAMGIYFPKIKKPEAPYKYLAGQYFIPNSSGILSQLDIDEKINKKPYLGELVFFKKIGAPVLVPPEGYEYLGWVTVSGDNPLNAQDNLEEAVKLVKYNIAKFNPGSSIGKTTQKNQFSFSALNKNIIIRSGKIERLRKMSIKNQRNLHIGIAYNLYSEEDGAVNSELSMVGQIIEKTLKERGYRTSFFDFNNLPKAFNDLKASDVDLVFNVCERINDSSLLEPHAASIFDALQIPYTGSSPFTLSLCIDKIRVKKLLSFHEIPTPKWDYVYSMDDEIEEDLKYPLIVKPANTDNSIGITNDSVVTNKKELENQLKKVLVDTGRPALIEEYIEGDEYDVSILGSEEDDLRVLPLSRSIFSKLPKGYWHIYPFEAKWNENSIYKKCITVQKPPKNINKKLATLIAEIALDTYNILDCHDYGRVEIRVDKNNNPYVLELNPNPSINTDDCVAQVAKLAGMDYGDFIEEIIRMAIERYKNKPPYYHLQTKFL